MYHPLPPVPLLPKILPPPPELGKLAMMLGLGLLVAVTKAAPLTGGGNPPPPLQHLVLDFLAGSCSEGAIRDRRRKKTKSWNFSHGLKCYKF